MAADPSLRARHAELTRDLILRTVVERLEEGAHVDITVPEIARRSGISLRTIYRYFPSRAELMAGVAELVREDLQPTFAQHVDELPELWEQIVRRFEQHPNLARALALSQTGQEVNSPIRRQRLEHIQQVLEEVTGNLSKAEARQAHAVVVYLSNVLTWVTMRDELGLETPDIGAAVSWALRTLIDDLRRRNEAAGANGKASDGRRSHG
jgi:AcrR family transcriptional regulator